MSSSRFRAELWPDRSLVIARLGRVRPHRHGSLALLVGLDGAFLLQRGGNAQCVREAVVPAGQLHSLDCGRTEVGVIYLFPTCDALAGLSRDQRFRHAGQAAWLSALRKPLREISEGETPHGLFQQLSAAPVQQEPRWDARVRCALEAFEGSLMHPDAGQRLSLSEVGQSVGLSPSRLSHVFRSTLGVSPGRYRRWVQMRSACMRRAHGDSITHAALGAGFADSSHFAHAFVSTFGIAPTQALGRNAVLKVHSK